MITIEKTEVYGWKTAIRGMRNPMNSWDKDDSIIDENGLVDIGENNLKLMKNLVKSGSDHSKFMRVIVVSMDITAPLYWWKEFDTYKVSTVRNSCSTMHKIHDKEFTLDDFSHEQMTTITENMLKNVIGILNVNRQEYIETKDKFYWWQMIQLLPSSYNQKATIQLNYQVLRNMYHSRKNHKLDEWIDFCKWIESLPYSELITL